MTPTKRRNPPTSPPAQRDRAGRGAALGAILLLVLPAALAAAEPFYQARLEEGIRAYASGGYDTAVRDLRIACFGLLDEPQPLARGLTYLALAQAETGDREAFATSFRRILEAEQRFQAYSEAELAPAVRQAFEARLERWDALETLSSVPAFAAVARRMLEARIVAMPPPERRQELERRLAAAPDDAVWRLLMAELELAAGNFEAAATAADPVAAREPEGSPRLPWALCIRGRAQAAVGDCASALRNLPACTRVSLGVDVAEIQLQCYAQLGDWKRGMVLLSELPPDRRQSPAIRRLAKLFERERRLEIRTIRRAPAPVPAGGEPTAADAMADEPSGVGEPNAPTAAAAEPLDAVAPPDVAESPTVESPTATPPVAAAPPAASPDLATRVAEARGVLRSSSSREELTAVFERMRGLADRQPENPELQVLVAEISYRLRRWSEVVAYFERGGSASAPDQQFYLAVALYETGDRAAAARALDLCLPNLEETAVVRGYVEKIRAGQE